MKQGGQCGKRGEPGTPSGRQRSDDRDEGMQGPNRKP